MLFVYEDSRWKDHRPGPGHPERPERLDAARRGLQGLSVQRRTAEPAEPGALHAVHTEAHVRRVCDSAGRPAVFDADTVTSEGSVQAALLAAGAAVDAAHQLAHGHRSLVLSRPPGHHAPADRAMGFCLFNNAAVAAAALADQGIRVAVFDPDVHHGNGTEAIFAHREDVLYVSLHRWPFYPGTGAAEVVYGGANLNVPLPAGSGDRIYVPAMDQVVVPAMERFAPDAVIISAGYDALGGDPLGGMQLSVEGLATLWRRLCERWPCMAVLEGGYDLDLLEQGIAATARVLDGQDTPSVDVAPPAPWQHTLQRWDHPLLP